MARRVGLSGDRGAVLVAVIAGVLIFCREAPDIWWRVGLVPERIGAAAEASVGPRERDRRRWPVDR